MEHNFMEHIPREDIQSVSIFEHAEGWRWKRSAGDHFNLWLAIQGQGQFELDGKSLPFSAGTIFLFAPSTSFTASSTGSNRMINFSAHIADNGQSQSLLNSFPKEPAPVHLRNFIWAAHLCRFLSEAFFFNPTGSEQVVVSGLELLLCSMRYESSLEPTDAVNERLIQTVERIRRNPAAAYTVGEMADAAHLSETQFTRRFKKITGLTPNRFIVEERLGRAESYLRETDMTVQEIATRLGYQDIYFFSRQFRHFRGVPPTRIRKAGAPA